MATPTNLPATFVSGNILTAAQQNSMRGAFRVLTVVFTSQTTTASANSATYVTSGLTTAITPQENTNKVLIQGCVNLYNDTAGGEAGIRLVRTVGATTTTLFSIGQVKTGASFVIQVPFMWLDSPTTTSAATYTLQIARPNGTGIIYAQINNNLSMMTLQEISA